MVIPIKNVVTDQQRNILNFYLFQFWMDLIIYFSGTETGMLIRKTNICAFDLKYLEITPSNESDNYPVTGALINVGMKLECLTSC